MPASTLALSEFVQDYANSLCDELEFESPQEKAGRVLLTAALRVLYGYGVSLVDIHDAVSRQWDAMTVLAEATDSVAAVVAEPFRSSFIPQE